jgi:peptide/nickel transport system permease protein
VLQVYIIRRLAQLPPTLIAISIIAFIAVRMLPGDTALLLSLNHQAGQEITSTAQAEIDELRSSLGLNDPWHVQYVRWSRDMLTLDLGRSPISGRDILSEILRKAPVTLELAGFATLLALVTGLPAGIISAVRRDTWADYLIRIFSLAGVALPHFWLGTIIILVGLIFFTWAPPIEYMNLSRSPIDHLTQLSIPAVILGYSAGAIVARVTRSSLLEVLGEDYIRTAYAKGLSPRTILHRHALRNALLPVVTITGLIFTGLISGSIIMEQMFGLPGLGLYLLDGIRLRDYGVIQALVILFSIFIMLINLVVDISYVLIDPRIIRTLH